MVFCALTNLILLTVLVGLLFGLGYLGGLPAWYRNMRDNRANCEDLEYARDPNKWNAPKNEPKKDLDKRIWNFARSLQGNDSRFQTNLASKTIECA
jgi:hypothetical protein